MTCKFESHSSHSCFLIVGLYELGRGVVCFHIVHQCTSIPQIYVKCDCDCKCKGESLEHISSNC